MQAPEALRVLLISRDLESEIKQTPLYLDLIKQFSVKFSAISVDLMLPGMCTVSFLVSRERDMMFAFTRDKVIER